MNETMKFEYRIKLTAADLWKFSMYHANRGLLLPFNLLITFGALFMLIFRWNEFSSAYRILLLMCVGMFTIWQPVLLYLKASKQARMSAVKDEMKVAFLQDGVQVEQVGKKALITWEQVARVERTPSMIVLYMDRIHAYLVPKSVLGDSEQELREYLRKMVPPNRRKRI